MITIGMLLAWVFLLSCDQVEDQPSMQLSLSNDTYLVKRYSTLDEAPKSSPVSYRMDFINDSTFILHLDINRLVGNYEAAQDGTFRVKSSKQTNSCCDSAFAIELAQTVLQTQRYQITEEGITLQGNGEVFLTKKEYQKQ